jgi:hypothetical protein
MNLLNDRYYYEELIKNATKNKLYFYFFIALIILLNIMYYFKLYKKDTFFTPFIPAVALIPFIYFDNKNIKS